MTEIRTVSTLTAKRDEIERSIANYDRLEKTLKQTRSLSVHSSLRPRPHWHILKKPTWIDA
jgi:hypothetical protein